MIRNLRYIGISHDYRDELRAGKLDGTPNVLKENRGA